MGRVNMSNISGGNRFSRAVQNPLIPAVLLYSLAWVLTYGVMRIKWGSKLGLLNPLLLLADFIIPLALILALILLTKKSSRPFKWFGLLYLLLFSGVMVNIMVIKFHLANYGDVGTLSGMIAHNQVYPRWMLGTGILGFVIHHVSFPFFSSGDDLLLIRTLSALVMCFSTALFLFVFPKRMSLVLAFTSPFWLLLCSGYDEYYPFIAPLFILFLLVLSAKMDHRFSAVLVGLFAAIIGMTYTGFLPLAIILLFVYMIWRGFRRALVATLVCIAASLGLIILFYGTDFAAIWHNFQINLNIVDPEKFPGQSMKWMTFFKPVFAFGAENFNRMFLEFFWTGSFPYLLLILGGGAALLVKRSSSDNTRAGIFLGLFLLYQLLYFVFMIPQLGVVDDIDLYFSFYLTLAFTAGWLLDRIGERLDDLRRKSLQLAGFSFCAGSTAVVTLYLLFLGLYALV